MFALALPTSPSLPWLPCTQVWGKVSIKKHSSTGLWQRKQELPEPRRDKYALQSCLAMDRQDKKISFLMHTCLSYFCLLMSRTAIAVSMNSEFTIATIQEHHKFWCPAGAIGLTGGLGSIFVLCEDL